MFSGTDDPLVSWLTVIPACATAATATTKLATNVEYRNALLQVEQFVLSR